MKEADCLLARSDRYLKSAGLLIDDKDYESAVSRAYYAMFFAAEATLLTKGIALSSHKAVLSAFGEHFVKTGVFAKELSKSLIRAFEKKADLRLRVYFCNSGKRGYRGAQGGAGFRLRHSRFYA